MDSPPPSYRRTLTGFEPVSATARRFWQETARGDVVKMEGKRPRNLARHNYYWKMLEVATNNLEQFDTPEQLHVAVKATLGLGEWKDVGGSRPLFYPASTAFDKMTEAEFAEYLDAAAKAITKHWLAVPVEVLMEEARAA